MGVSLEWRPVDPKTGYDFQGGSRLHKILEDAFGSYPITFGEEHLGVLRGIKLCGHEGVNDLITAIYDHGKIEVDCCW